MPSILDRLFGRPKKEEKKEEQAPARVDEEVARERREQLARERQEREEARKRFEEQEKARLAALEEEKKRLELERLAQAERERLAAKAQAAEARIYVVKAGDYLSKIAKEIYGDAKRWPEIYEANKETIGPDPNIIHPGQKLRIP